MRILLTAAVVGAALFAVPGASAAGTGHWYCTADGIKAWTSDAGMKDAAGWKYAGDATSYKDQGKCQKGS